MRRAATLAVVTLLACSSEASIVGEWRYDRDRLATLAVVTEADPAPTGSFASLHADDSWRATTMRALEEEARTTTIRISDKDIVVKGDGVDEKVAYRLVKRTGDDWLLVVEEDGVDHPMTATLAGKRLTIVDEHDRIRYVLVRK